MTEARLLIFILIFNSPSASMVCVHLLILSISFIFPFQSRRLARVTTQMVSFLSSQVKVISLLKDCHAPSHLSGPFCARVCTELIWWLLCWSLEHQTFRISSKRKRIVALRFIFNCIVIILANQFMIQGHSTLCNIFTWNFKHL